MRCLVLLVCVISTHAFAVTLKLTGDDGVRFNVSLTGKSGCAVPCSLDVEPGFREFDVTGDGDFSTAGYFENGKNYLGTVHFRPSYKPVLFWTMLFSGGVLLFVPAALIPAGILIGGIVGVVVMAIVGAGLMLGAVAYGLSMGPPSGIDFAPEGATSSSRPPAPTPGLVLARY